MNKTWNNHPALIFDATQMAGISRDLADASVMLGSCDHVRFLLA